MWFFVDVDALEIDRAIIFLRAVRHLAFLRLDTNSPSHPTLTKSRISIRMSALSIQIRRNSIILIALEIAKVLDDGINYVRTPA